MIELIESQNGDRNLSTEPICWTGTPDADHDILCQAVIYLGDGTKDLDGSGGLFEVRMNLGDQVGCPHLMAVSPGKTRAWFRTELIPIPAGAVLTVKVLSPNVADTDVDVTVKVYNVLETAADILDRLKRISQSSPQD